MARSVEERGEVILIVCACSQVVCGREEVGVKLCWRQREVTTCVGRAREVRGCASACVY